MVEAGDVDCGRRVGGRGKVPARDAVTGERGSGTRGRVGKFMYEVRDVVVGVLWVRVRGRRKGGVHRGAYGCGVGRVLLGVVCGGVPNHGLRAVDDAGGLTEALGAGGRGRGGEGVRSYGLSRSDGTKGGLKLQLLLLEVKSVLEFVGSSSLGMQFAPALRPLIHLRLFVDSATGSRLYQPWYGATSVGQTRV